jgi:hypothetical protein
MATSTERGTRHRRRAEAAEAATIAGMGQAGLQAAVREAVDLLAGAGLPAPSLAELAAEPPADRALATGRIISAATHAISLARKRRELIPAAEATAIAVGLATRVRAALDRAPAYLSADLPPAVREAASSAMALAIQSAMAELDRDPVL